MKNNLFALLLALPLGLLAPRPTAAADAGQPVCLQQVDEFRYLVRISNPAQQATTLRLLRQSDQTVLYEQQSRLPACGQQLNLRNLADGHYAVLVRIGRTDYRYDLLIQTTTRRETVLRPGPVASR